MSAKELGSQVIFLRKVRQDDKHPISPLSIIKNNNRDAINPRTIVPTNPKLLLQHLKLPDRKPINVPNPQRHHQRQRVDRPTRLKHSLITFAVSHLRVHPQIANPFSRSDKQHFPVQSDHLQDG